MSGSATCRGLASHSSAFRHSRHLRRKTLPVGTKFVRGLATDSNTQPTASQSQTDPNRHPLAEIVKIVKDSERREVEDRVKRPTKPSRNTTSYPKSTRFVLQPEDGINGLPMALALLREAEVRYGRAQEFVFPKDSEISTQYLPFFFAFLDKGKDATPETPKTFPLVDPPILRPSVKLEGNVGLEDIAPFLRPKEVDRRDEDIEEDTQIENPQLFRTLQAAIAGNSASEPTSPDEGTPQMDGSDTGEDMPLERTLDGPTSENVANEAEELAPAEQAPPLRRIVYTRIRESRDKRRYRSEIHLDSRTIQAFTKWGGFFPYDYLSDSSLRSTSTSHAALVKDLEGSTPESNPHSTAEERKRWRARQATVAMSTTLYRLRNSLRQRGERDHGMVRAGEVWKIKEHLHESDDAPRQGNSSYTFDEVPLDLQDEAALNAIDAADPAMPLNEREVTKGTVEESNIHIAPKTGAVSESSEQKEKTRRLKRIQARKAREEMQAEGASKPLSTSEAGSKDVNDNFREKMWGFVRQVWR